MTEKKQTSVNLDREHYDWMKSENINFSGLVNDLIAEYRSRGSQVDTAVKRFRINQIESQIQSNESENERLRDELERIRTHVDVSQQQYDGELEDILSHMERGMTIGTDAPRIKNLALDFYGDKTRAPEVISDLKERAADRDIADDQWGEP